MYYGLLKTVQSFIGKENTSGTDGLVLIYNNPGINTYLKEILNNKDTNKLIYKTLTLFILFIYLFILPVGDLLTSKENIIYTYTI